MSFSFGSLQRPKRIVVIGGGPGGTSCATHAAQMGAEVTLIEKDIVGGAAHLLDCVPSKAMIATASAMSDINSCETMGLAKLDAQLDFNTLKSRIKNIEHTVENSLRDILKSQGVNVIEGIGRIVSKNEVAVKVGEQENIVPGDVIVISTGSRPRIPEWASIDGKKVLTTRHAYPPLEMPDHLIVVGSGVTGVEFVHMFNSFGSKVTLVVSRQQILPNKDPEVASVLEDSFVDRGVNLLMGARACGLVNNGDELLLEMEDGRKIIGSHVLFAIGSIPNIEYVGLENAGVSVENGYVDIDHNCRTNIDNIYAAGDVTGKLLLSSVASRQGKKIAEHAMGKHVGPHSHIDYSSAASAIFTDPEIADVGIVESEAFSQGRKIRVTKVPFSSSAKALINADSRGFVKIVTDPATGIILGGSIVGKHAGELISVLALAVTAKLKVSDLTESLFVHPALAEAINEASE